MKFHISLITLMLFFIITAYAQIDNKNLLDGTIDSFEDLIWLSENPDVWNENWALTADIDAGETAGMNGGLGFSPLGDSPSGLGVRQGVSFTGSFDGQGFTISNITINRSNEPYVGFFGHIEGGSVQNLSLENITVNGYRYVGGFVGYLTQQAEIAACSVQGEISGEEYVGGMIGITYAYNLISESHSAGTVSTNKWGGGFVGDNYNYTDITDSYSSCQVTGVDYLGGFAGNNRWFSNIYKSYTTGDVTGSGWYVGGFVGDNNEGRIENSFSTGKATGTFGTGGFSGHNYWLENDDMGIFNCYATGFVSGSTLEGAFSGFNEGYVEDCYWDTETAGLSEGCGSGCGASQVTLTGLSTAGFADESNFTNWDFENIWTITTLPDISPFQRPYLGILNQVYELILIPSPEEGGEVMGSGNYMAGEEITISAIANPVWAFENWTDEEGAIVSEESETTIVMPEEPIVLYANFKTTVGLNREVDELIFMYPNPASDNVFIKTTDSGDLKLINTEGQLVLERQIEENEILDISHLSRGSYFVLLKTRNTVCQRILIKE